MMSDKNINNDESTDDYIARHVEPVFGAAIDYVADDHGVDRDELAAAVAGDLVWVGIYDKTDEYEDAAIHPGDLDTLEVSDHLRPSVQYVHDRAANTIVGVDMGSYNDMYVSPTSLAPNDYSPGQSNDG